MLVKVTVSAAGADFVLNYGQELEFDALKAMIGNGAENFCLPVDPDVAWPPAEQPAERDILPDDIERDVVPAVEPAQPKRKARK